jgi:hypothetical protein
MENLAGLVLALSVLQSSFLRAFSDSKLFEQSFESLVLGFRMSFKSLRPRFLLSISFPRLQCETTLVSSFPNFYEVSPASCLTVLQASSRPYKSVPSLSGLASGLPLISKSLRPRVIDSNILSNPARHVSEIHKFLQVNQSEYHRFKSLKFCS